MYLCVKYRAVVVINICRMQQFAADARRVADGRREARVVGFPLWAVLVSHKTALSPKGCGDGFSSPPPPHHQQQRPSIMATPKRTPQPQRRGLTGTDRAGWSSSRSDGFQVRRLLAGTSRRTHTTNAGTPIRAEICSPTNTRQRAEERTPPIEG